jgi:hypothetical protein
MTEMGFATISGLPISGLPFAVVEEATPQTGVVDLVTNFGPAGDFSEDFVPPTTQGLEEASPTSLTVLDTPITLASASEDFAGSLPVEEIATSVAITDVGALQMSPVTEDFAGSLPIEESVVAQTTDGATTLTPPSSIAEDFAGSLPVEETAASFALTSDVFLASIQSDEEFAGAHPTEEMSPQLVIFDVVVMPPASIAEDFSGSIPNEEAPTFVLLSNGAIAVAVQSEEEFAGSAPIEESSAWSLTTSEITSIIATYDEEFAGSLPTEEAAAEQRIFVETALSVSSTDEEFAGSLPIEEEAAPIVLSFAASSILPNVDEEFSRSVVSIEESGAIQRSFDALSLVEPSREEEFTSRSTSIEEPTALVLTLSNGDTVVVSLPDEEFVASPAVAIEEESAQAHFVQPTIVLPQNFDEEFAPQPTPPPPPPPPKPPLFIPSGAPQGEGAAVSRWVPPREPWTPYDTVVKDQRLREIFEKADRVIVKWEPQSELDQIKKKIEDEEPVDATAPVIVENVVDVVYVSAPSPVVVRTRAYVPRWIGWTFVAVGATAIGAGVALLPKKKLGRGRRRRKR